MIKVKHLAVLAFLIVILPSCGKNPAGPSDNQGGERILFIRSTGTVDRKTISEICTMSPDGSDIHVIARYSPGNDLIREPYFAVKWAPNQDILVVEGGPGTTMEYSSLWLMDMDGNLLTRLTLNAYDPYWSEDGEHVIFSRRRGYFAQTCDIFRIHTTTLKEDTLLFADAEYLYWLYGIIPGLETHLLLREMYIYTDSLGVQRHEDAEIIIYDYSTSEKIYLTDNDYEEGWVSISPDGQQIAYTRKTSDPYSSTDNLYMMTISGENNQQLTTGTLRSYWHPVWSPDGTKLMFSAVNPYNEPFSSGNENFVIVIDLSTGMMNTIIHNSQQSNQFHDIQDWR